MFCRLMGFGPVWTERKGFAFCVGRTRAKPRCRPFIEDRVQVEMPSYSPFRQSHWRILSQRTIDGIAISPKHWWRVHVKQA